GRKDDLRLHVEKVTDAAKAAGATDGEPTPGATPAAPRDANTGRFTREARSVHAQRRQAGAGEVGRIAELTRRLREAEGREADWKQKYESRGSETPTPSARQDQSITASDRTPQRSAAPAGRPS